MDTKQTVPVIIYTEATPNPTTLKYVANRILFDKDYVEFTSINQTDKAPLAKALFETNEVTNVFISNAFVTVTKKEETLWIELTPRIKKILTFFLESETPIFAEDFTITNRKASNEVSDSDSEIDIRIKETLEKYVKPAVEMDGGAISFVSFDDNGILTLALQGSCSGCPSSTVTLKDGIQNLMLRMVPEVKEVVALAD